MGELISISNRQEAQIDQQGVIRLALETLRGQGIEAAELSISFVEEAEMERLHLRYMDETGPTDVLSFPMDGPPDATPSGDGVRLLGDVVIAPAVAARNNPADPAAEVRLLLVHGILHLLGFDHEEEAERAKMWALQEHYSGVKAS